MKIAKIPYSAAEVEVIFFSVEDILTTSNIDKDGADINNPNEDDDWGTNDDGSFWG